MSQRSSFYPELKRDIASPHGKLGVLIPGLGAVATTLIAGVHLINKGLSQPYGSLTQMQRMRLGKRTSPRYAPIKEVVPLADLNNLVFAGWDIFPEDAYQTACHAGVLPRELLDQVKDQLEAVRPWPAVFDQAYVRRLSGTNLKSGLSKKHLADLLIADIEAFRRREETQRVVMIWCGSTEVFMQPAPVHETIEAFEAGLKANAPEISSSMIYAYAAISAGVPFANGSPSLTVDIPALVEFAHQRHVPIAGKDFKTGQTFLKTVVAPGLKAKMLGLNGWFSTNILGNRDGEVLDDQGSFRTKEVSKGSVLEAIVQPELYPELYGQVFHRSGSSTTRRVAMPKKDGTTSTSSVGSASRCRSRLTSSVGIPFWRRRWFSIWRCFWTWRNGPDYRVFRSGCRSTSSLRWPERPEAGA